MDELAIDVEQDAIALSSSSSQLALSRVRTPSTPNSFVSAGSYRNVRFASPRGSPPPCRICLTREQVNRTTLTTATRAAILQNREKNYHNLKDTHTGSGTYQIAQYEARSCQRGHGYRTRLWTTLIPLTIALPVQPSNAAPVTPQRDTATHVAQPPQHTTSRNRYPSAQEHRRDHA